MSKNTNKNKSRSYNSIGENVNENDIYIVNGNEYEVERVIEKGEGCFFDTLMQLFILEMELDFKE